MPIRQRARSSLRVLLIRKEFKQGNPEDDPRREFESLVNTEGIQTLGIIKVSMNWFESLVNTEGIQTFAPSRGVPYSFESLVNTEGIQTFRL